MMYWKNIGTRGAVTCWFDWFMVERKLFAVIWKLFNWSSQMIAASSLWGPAAFLCPFWWRWSVFGFRTLEDVIRLKSAERNVWSALRPDISTAWVFVVQPTPVMRWSDLHHHCGLSGSQCVCHTQWCWAKLKTAISTADKSLCGHSTVLNGSKRAEWCLCCIRWSERPPVSWLTFPACFLSFLGSGFTCLAASGVNGSAAVCLIDLSDSLFCFYLNRLHWNKHSFSLFFCLSL